MIVVVVKNGVVWEVFSDDDEEILVVDRDVAREQGTLTGMIFKCLPAESIPWDIKSLVRDMGLIVIYNKEGKTT